MKKRQCSSKPSRFGWPTAINEANAGQWPHCFTRFFTHSDKDPMLGIEVTAVYV